MVSIGEIIMCQIQQPPNLRAIKEMLLAWAFEYDLLITDQNERTIAQVTTGHVSCLFTHFQNTGCATASLDHTTIDQFGEGVVENIVCVDRLQIFGNACAIVH